jgi:hypothetical protein
MTKGQQRSNKEARKPKKEKSAAQPVPSLGAQVRLAGDNKPKSRSKG